MRIPIGLGAFLIVGTLMLAFSPAADSLDLPKTAHEFETVVDNEILHLGVDKKSIHDMVGNDGRILSGAVIRLAYKKPFAPSPTSNIMMSTFINSVIAVCDRNGVLLVKSEIYDERGNKLDEVLPMEPLQAAPGSVTLLVYQHLCKGKSNKGPGYKLFDT